MRSLSVAIGRAGALIDVQIGVNTFLRGAIRQAGQVPNPNALVTLLIDTGASHTLIDEGVMRQLGVQPTRTDLQYHSATTGHQPARCNVYDVSLSIGSAASKNLLRFDPMQVMGDTFLNQSYHGLLGRDVLNRVQLHWNGPTQSLVISYT